MTINDATIFWINLDDRVDRARACVKQIETLNLDITSIRISAVSRQQIGVLPNTDNQHDFQGVLACRRSHLKAMASFLESNSSYAIILEDDFRFSDFITKSEVSNLLLEMKRSDLQLLQIGFLPSGNRFKFPLFKIVSTLSIIIRKVKIHAYKKQITNQFVKWRLKPGSHAYIIDKRMALYILNKSEVEPKVPYDLWLLKLSCSSKAEYGAPKSARLRFSIVEQNGVFKSDIQS